MLNYQRVDDIWILRIYSKDDLDLLNRIKKKLLRLRITVIIYQPK